jgi:hypothetical protein
MRGCAHCPTPYMPTEAELKTVALTELERLSQKDVCPTLDSANDLEPILTNANRLHIWLPSHAYVFGNKVVPTYDNQNGHAYICTRAGTSDSTEPDFPLSENATITDGTVIWKEYSIDYGYELWDLNQAAREAWRLKSQRATNFEDFKVSDRSYSDSQVYDHCVEMMEQFKSTVF